MIEKLVDRNIILFRFGIYNFVLAFICLSISMYHFDYILGINAFIKPFKYFFSVAVTSWSLAILLYYIHSKPVKKVISWVTVVSLFLVTSIVFLQAYRGETSHYNVSTPFNKFLYEIMIGSNSVFLLAMTVTTIMLFKQKKMSSSQHFAWGIRMGFLFFIIFSLVGFYMMFRMSHTMGGEDGGKGIFFFNWSTHFGDFRIAHMLGVHSLQIIPLVSYYGLKKKNQILFFSCCYFILVTTLFIMAFLGMPLIPIK